MSEIVKSRYQGILVPDERFSLDKLTASDHATAPSSYSQAGPKPGIPAAQQSTRMVLQASGEQPAGGDLEVHSVRAGHPGLERAGYLWSDQSIASPVEYGWDVPQLMTGWGHLFWSTDATELAATPSVIRLQSGKLLAAGLQDKTTFHQTIKSYDPDAVTKWSTVGTVAPDNPTAQSGPGLCQLPSGRVLLFLAQGTQVDCYFSDDDGVSWEPYSYRVLDVPVLRDDIRQIRADYSGGEVLLLIQYNHPTIETAAQYASDDLGGRFTQIVADWNDAFVGVEEANFLNIVSLDSGFLVVYHAIQGADGYCRSREIGSAFSSVIEAESVDIANGVGPSGKPGLAAYSDDSGVIYAIYKQTGSTYSDLKIARSDSGGAAWESVSTEGAFSSGALAVSLQQYAAASVAGHGVVLARWSNGSSAEDPQSLGVVYLGGHSTHTGPAEVGTVTFSDSEYVSFSRNTDLGISGGSWLPIAVPGDVNWTVGGTGSDALTSGKLELVTSGAQRFFYRNMSGDDDIDRIFAEFALEIDDGDGDTATNQIGALLLLGNGANKWEVVINASSAGWALYDVAGAQIGGTVTTDITKQTHIRVAMEQGQIKTWWAPRSNVTYRNWTEGPGGAVSPTASADASRVQWGHSHLGSNTSRWGMVGYCFWPKFWSPTSHQYASSWSTPDDLHPRSYSTEPSQIVDKTRVAAVAGPTRYGERWRVQTDYDYPTRALFPTNAPSPRAAWRSTDTTEQILAWDISELTSARIENTSLACVLLGINFKTAVLEKNVGGVWSTVCTINAAEGFESLRFEREGGVVFPESFGSAHKAGRYVMYDELPGGTFYDATNTKYRKITENTEGAWTNEPAKQPFVTIAGADDTEAISGDCEIWAPNAAGIAHSYTSNARFYRLRIPAQTTADGYFEIGQMAVGPLAVFGSQYGRGRQIVARNNTEQINLPNGEVRARKRGPQAREVEFAWTTGVDATQINQADPVPDYVAAGAGQMPMASLKDTLYLMDGVIRRQGGAGKPVVYFARIAADSTDDQTNNPREFVYGRITGNATRSNILGDEEKTDLDRLNTITIQELV